MALIDCPECGTQVSSAAPSCPKCGFPVAVAAAKTTGKGRFDEAARAAGVDLSVHEGPLKSPRASDAQVAVLLSQRKQTNHILHLLLSIVTGGLWLIVWLLVASSNSSHNRQIESQLHVGKGGAQRERLRTLAYDAASSESRRRRKWGEETLERLQREDEGYL
jgi:hypothetical protein